MEILLSDGKKVAHIRFHFIGPLYGETSIWQGRAERRCQVPGGNPFGLLRENTRLLIGTGICEDVEDAVSRIEERALPGTVLAVLVRGANTWCAGIRC